MENKIIDENIQGTATLVNDPSRKNGKKLYLESYGCAMNFSDSEIVASILLEKGYETTKNHVEADVILINTCSIRDKAEQTTRKRLTDFNSQKKSNPGLIIGVLGCMAERMKSTLLEEEKLVDIVVGPDAYRDLPSLIENVEGGQKGVNVLLSRDETYADINPVRLADSGVSAFVSITRGCDNMCSFCVVPFTRGRERSRNPLSIVAEARDLFNRGYREVTLLGQNVNSYRWNISKKGEITDTSIPTTNFAELLEMVALVDPKLRIRYSTSHPKDMGDDVLEVMAKYDNICKYIHLPVQSGSSEVLKKMNRGYTRELFLDRVSAINRILPGCTISTDIITGFSGETEEQHQETLSLIDKVGFNLAYMYFYSERPKTLAERKYEDDIPEKEKKKRLNDIIQLQHKKQAILNKNSIGNVYEVLIDKVSRKSTEMLSGRNTHNSMLVFPKEDAKIGDYVHVLVEDCTTATLIGKIVTGDKISKAINHEYSAS